LLPEAVGFFSPVFPRAALSTLRQAVLLAARQHTLTRMLDFLDAQRKRQAASLHKGICQEMTASSLLVSLLGMEHPDNLDVTQLAHSLGAAGSDLRQFMERQVGPEPRTDLREATRIIVTTGAGCRGDAARCQELGVTAYLTKPVTSEDLVKFCPVCLGDAPPQDLVTRHMLREARVSSE